MPWALKIAFVLDSAGSRWLGSSRSLNVGMRPVTSWRAQLEAHP